MWSKIFMGIGCFVAVVVVTGYLLPKGAELRHEIRINAKAGQVWDILTNLEAVQHYNQTVSKAQYISPNKSGVGSARQCDLKDGSVVKEAVIALEEKTAVTMALTESPWPVENMKWRTELKADGGATQVSQVLTYDMKMGPVGRILNALVMKKKMHDTIAEVFANLRKYAETSK